MTRNDPNIYHYTSWKAFKSIFENHTLRLGDLGEMEDRKEQLRFVELMKAEVEGKLKKKGQENRTEELNDIIQRINSRVKEERTYSMCFTNARDSVVQWKGYGRDGTGVCIGIIRDKLEEYLKRNFGLAVVQPVFYLEKTEHDHSQILYDYLVDNEVSEFRDIGSWIENVIPTSSCFKHPSFTGEEETRLVTVPLDAIQHQLPGKFITEATDSMIRSYFELSLSENAFKDMVGEIVIGPRSKQDCQKLKRFLKDWGYQELAESDSIIRSSCPLR